MGRKIKTRESIWYNIINYGFEMIGRHYSSYRAFVVNNEYGWHKQQGYSQRIDQIK